MAKEGCSTIKVHNAELCAEILGTSGSYSQKDKQSVRHTNKVCSSRIPTADYRIERVSSSPINRIPSRSSTAQMTRIEDWLSSKARRSVMCLLDDQDLSHIKELCQNIVDKEISFISELNEFLESQEQQSSCKREMLFKKWTERVFDPIQSKINDQFHGKGYSSLDASKRKLFTDYLAYHNKKQVFLDTISPEDYNPVSPVHLTAHTGSLDDPLATCTHQPVGQGPVLGRTNTDCIQWLAMQLVHIDSSVRSRSRNRMLGVRNKSEVKEFSSLDKDQRNAQLKQELHIPHKKMVDYHRKPFKLHWNTP